METIYRKHAKAPRPCNANDAILVSAGVQCSNCMTLIVEHRHVEPAPTAANRAARKASEADHA